MFKLFHLVVVFNLFIWQICICQYVGQAHIRMQAKIVKLTQELVKDTEMKIAAIQHLKDDAAGVAFEVGSLTYRMRANLKRMVVLYRQVWDRKDDFKHPMEHFERMGEMDGLAHDTDNLAQMIEVHEERNKGRTKRNIRRRFMRTDDGKLLWENFNRAVQNEEFTRSPLENPFVEKSEMNNGRRKNGIWHYAVVNDFS